MRLGDLDALLDKFLRSYTEQEKVGNFQFVACEIKQGFADMVCEQPTIDAVSVVRCKDCIVSYCFGDEDIVCGRTGVNVDADDFCSYDERKGGDG